MSVDQLIPTHAPNTSAPKSRPIKIAHAAKRKSHEILASHIAGLEARSQTEIVFIELIATMAKRTNPDQSRRTTPARKPANTAGGGRFHRIERATSGALRLAPDIAPKDAAKKLRGRMNGRRSEKRGARCRKGRKRTRIKRRPPAGVPRRRFCSLNPSAYRWRC